VHDVEVVAQGEVLVHDLDTQVVRLLRVGDVLRLPLEEVLAVIERVDARNALDQGALAGTVVTHQRGDLACVDRQVDTLEHAHGAETLVDTLELQQGTAGFRHVVTFS
jgi:hypothetical protein